MRFPGLATSVAALALTAPMLVACGGDPASSYCAEVAKQAPKLTKTLDVGGVQRGLLDARPTLEALAAKAPHDIEAQWKTLLDALGGLQDALDKAGLKSADVDGKLPASLSQDKRKALLDASIKLASPETMKAADAVDQQARDVCQIPLF
jgi:hypothetical protein